MKPTLVKARQGGFGMIELLITMVIVLVMSLAIFGVLSSSEGQKRTLTATNDANQTGNYAIYQLDKILRQAGSGFASNTYNALGCELFANLNSTSSGGSTQILPFPSGTTMAAPFTSMVQGTTGLGGVFGLAPVVIAAGGTTPNVSGQASDALIVMSGTAGGSEFFTWVSGATKNLVSLLTSTGFNQGDLILLLPDSTAASVTSGSGASLKTTRNPCVVEEVSPTVALAAGSLSLGDATTPTYYANPIGTFDLTKATWASTTSIAMNIGNVASSPVNLPAFQMIGVGDNNVLYSYDLLQGGTTFNASVPITDSVFELHALYGLYDGTWVKPSTAGYDYVSLENGSVTSSKILQGITQIRIGLILRSALQEKTAVTPLGSVTLFSDLGTLSYSPTLTTAQQNFRYRTVEATIPIRNMIMARP